MVGKQGCSGRKSIKGFYAKESQYNMMTYTIIFKKAIIDNAEKNVATMLNFSPDIKSGTSVYESKRRLIYLW